MLNGDTDLLVWKVREKNGGKHTDPTQCGTQQKQVQYDKTGNRKARININMHIKDGRWTCVMCKESDSVFYC